MCYLILAVHIALWERESCGDGKRSAVSISLEAGKGGAGKKHLCSSVRADPCSTCVCINDAVGSPMETIPSMAPLNPNLR